MIDSHTHIGSYRISSPEIYGWLNVRVDDLTNYMKNYNIDKVWLLSHPDTVSGYKLNDNDVTLCIKNVNKNIYGFCYPNDSSEIPRFVGRGCDGVGEIKREANIDDKNLMKIYGVSGDFGLPVIIHSTDKHCVGNRKRFDNVFGGNPKTNFVMHGWGWWNQFGVDMEYYLDKYCNVFMDISANSGYKGLNKCVSSYIEAFFTKYSDRVLFGTDFPMLTTYDGTQFGVNNQHKLLIDSFNLSQTCLDNIFFKNAERLVK